MSNLLNVSQPSKLDQAYHVSSAKVIRLEKVLLFLWLILNLLVGALTVHEYGMSVDEVNNQRYAVDTLSAYPSFFGILYEPRYDSSYEGHGPAFVTLAAIFVRVVQAVFPSTFAPDLWHYSYFISFQLTGLCLYWLARRWFRMWTAWALLVLFGTQPLLLGHAFINPKDIPFMFFFTLSILWGFRMMDATSADEAYISLAKPAATLTDNFRQVEPRRRMNFFVYLTLAVVIGLALALYSGEVNTLIESLVRFFYNAEPGSWAGQLFHSVASTSIPAEDYVSKSVRLFDRIERGLLIAGILFFIAYFWILVSNMTLRIFLREAWAQRNTFGAGLKKQLEFLRNSVNKGLITTWFAEIFRAVGNPRVLLAGIALGLATGVRAIGPIAGVIVVFYLFAKVRTKAWATAIAYFLIAGIVTYIAWPRLWNAPVQRYLEALGVASNFPHFPGRVLFNSKLYGPSDLPGSYLPVLFNIQLTEPLVLGVYLGLALLIMRLLRDRIRADFLLYISLGFALPLLGLIALNSPLYHNFRQVLFLVPAMAILAAFALQFLFNKVSQGWVRVVLIAAIAFPGVYSMLKLHPYQYVYYNGLVGGPAGAVYRYELDYWRISLREMALELNKVASPGSIIVVTRSAGLLARYTRPDLVIDKPINSILDLDRGYDYIVHVTRGKGGDLYPEVDSLIAIERGGVVLVTAKYVKKLGEGRTR